MKTATISSRGQIAIPKEVREVLDIKAGDKFLLEVVGNTIVLKPSVTITVPKDQAYFWSEEIQKSLQKAEKNFQKGDQKKYTSKEFIMELDKRG